MRILEIQPRRGIGPFLLGMTREEAKAASGEPAKPGGTSEPESEWFLRGVCVHYGRDGRIEYIEAAGEPAYSVRYRGADAHRTEAARLVEILEADAALDEEYPDESVYAFPSLGIRLWNPRERDEEGGKALFETVAVGTDEYLAAGG